MNTTHQRNETFPYPSINFDEAAIRQRADRVGKQIGEAVSSLLAEIVLSIVMTRPEMAFQPSPNARRSPAAAIMPSRPDSILKAAEVAQILGISKAKAYKLMQQGEIRSIQFGRTTRVHRQDLDEFIKTHMK
jgi:excisionase family DNA binding protein